jgi:hypothetical protein
LPELSVASEIKFSVLPETPKMFLHLRVPAESNDTRKRSELLTALSGPPPTPIVPWNAPPTATTCGDGGAGWSVATERAARSRGAKILPDFVAKSR